MALPESILAKQEMYENRKCEVVTEGSVASGVSFGKNENVWKAKMQMV